jgi:hypothetical protein
MQSAIRVTTKVLPGDKVEVQVPEGLEGSVVEVVVTFPPKPPINRQNILEFLTQLRNRHPQRSVEEINRDLEVERSSWDS